MNIDVAKRWLEAKRTKKQLDQAIKDVNEEITNLEISMMDQMATEGVEQLKVDGATIFMTRIMKADVAYREGESTDEGYERTCDELVRVGLHHLVKRRFFHQTVSSWLSNGGDPNLINGFMRVSEITRLNVRNLGG